MIRRQFLTGIAAVLAAPAVIRTPGVLMPVRVIVPPPSPDAMLDHWAALHGLQRMPARWAGYETDDALRGRILASIARTLPEHHAAIAVASGAAA